MNLTSYLNNPGQRKSHHKTPLRHPSLTWKVNGEGKPGYRLEFHEQGPDGRTFRLELTKEDMAHIFAQYAGSEHRHAVDAARAELGAK